MKKSERLNGVVLLLKDRKRMTAQELALYFEVSERTIYRDIDALSQLKVPIIAFEGLGGGYEISPAYFMPTIQLTRDESIILLMVLKMGSEIKMPNLSKRYDLIKSKIINSLDAAHYNEVDSLLNKIHFYISKIEPSVYSDDVMMTLLNAIQRNKRINITYYAPMTHSDTERIVSIDQLFFEDGGWYITGYCHLRDEKRTFRIDRIHKSIIVDEETLSMETLKSSTNQYKRTSFQVMITSGFYRVIKENHYMRNHKVELDGEWLQLTIVTKQVNDILGLAMMHPSKFIIKAPTAMVNEVRSKINQLNKIYL